MKLKLATRGSKLALAQSYLIADALKSHHPNLEIEYVVIKNSVGDVDKTTPLWQMDKVGIFSHEIDKAILEGHADFAVHSLKDLGTKRPQGLILAAVPTRADPRDVLLFRPNILDKIKNGETIVIGSSAPRRVELLPLFLAKAFPNLGSKKPVIQTVSIRGNIDSRIERLRLDRGSEKAVDGICLAMAGLSRLYNDKDGHETLARSLKGLKWMVLPVTACPGAPGQAALAVEAREDRKDVLNILKSIHDPETAKFIKLERDFLIQQGGGCHQRFGALALRLPNMDRDVLIVEGVNETGKDISSIYFDGSHSFDEKKIWSGVEWRDRMVKPEKIDFKLPSMITAVFATHARAVPENISPSVRLWTSGIGSWFSLAARGFWVEGCADGFGFDFVESTLCEKVLQLPQIKEWAILTHTGGQMGWKQGHVVATYAMSYYPDKEAIAALEAADVVLWSSGSQYQALKKHVKSGAIHATGPGRTADLLKREGLAPLVLPSVMTFAKTSVTQGQKNNDKNKSRSKG